MSLLIVPDIRLCGSLTLFTAYEKCGNWEYIGKVFLSIRHGLNSLSHMERFVIKESARFNKIHGVIKGLKLFSILGVPNTVFSIKSVAAENFKKVPENGFASFALPTLTCSLLIADLVDSAGSFTNAALMLTGKQTIGLYNLISLPLTYYLITMGAVSRSFKFYDSYNKYKISTTEEDKLQKYKDCIFHSMLIGSNIVGFVGLNCYSFSFVHPAAPPFIISTSFVIKISAQVFRDFK